jgi:hypothetical protein
MIDKGENLMIDKGDNFGGTGVAPSYGTILLVSALVSLAVSLATVLVTLWLVSRSGMVTPEEGATVSVPMPPPAQPPSPGETIQRGTINPPLGNPEGEVYYAIPFASPPNLTVTNGFSPKFTEQRKDGFKYKADGAAVFQWEARGLKAN